MKREKYLTSLFLSILSFGLNGQIDSLSGGKPSAWYKFSSDQTNIRYQGNQNEALNLVMFKDKKELKGSLANNSDQDILVLTQDGSLIIIAEALKEEKWIPIEFWIWSDCGNSYLEPLALKAQKLINFEVSDFKGSVKSKLRLKMCTGEQIIYSNEIVAKVGERYFNELKPSFKKEYWWVENYYINDCINQLKELKETLEEMKCLSKLLGLDEN